MNPTPHLTASGPDKERMLARLREIGPLIEPINGWLDPNAGGVLYQLALKVAPSPVVVELGSWKGRSTAWLAYGLRDRGAGTRVIAIDTWAGTQNEPGHAKLLDGYGPDQLYQEFLGNLRGLGLEDQVEPWRMTSVQAARRWDRGTQIGLLHIDADHSYEGVRADFEHWSPYVVSGGLVVFDDVPTWPGPTRIITELPRWFRFFASSPNQFVFVKE
jgi:predicted O-methyltransferase YrrM